MRHGTRTPRTAALLGGAAALTAFTLGAALGKAAAPTGPVKALGAFLGSWKVAGVSYDTPYSKASHDSANTVCSWAATNDYLVCSQAVRLAAGESHAISIFTYDPTAKQYLLYSVPSPGASPRKVPFTIAGNTWTYPFEYDDKGKHIFGRTVNVFQKPGHVTYTVQYSLDQKTWVTGTEGAETRVP